MARKFGWMVLAIPLALLAWGCGGESENKDEGGTPDVPADVADVPQDLGHDSGPVEDVPPVDVPPTDPGPTTDTPMGEDIEDEEGAHFPDVPLADVDFESLPTLPAGKTFTTRYAAGVARKSVDPEQPVHLGGFGFCAGDENLCRSSEGIHDSVYASAVAIADTVDKKILVFVGVDSTGLLRADIETMHHMLQNQLAAEGIYFPGNQLIISASHAHSSPDATGIWGALYGAGRQEWYTDMLRDRVVEAAKEAVLNLADVQLAWGKGSSQNHDEDGFLHDDELFIIKGVKPGEGGETVFTLMRWPAHPTAYGSENFGISSDWVGTYRKKMETVVGGMAIYLQGPIGSVYPERPGECGETVEAFPDGYHTPYVDKYHPGIKPEHCMKVTCTGYLVAKNAITALETLQPVAETGIDYRFGDFWFHPTNGSLMLLAQIGPLPFPWVDLEDPNSQMSSIFGWARLGDLNILTTPGESFPSFAAGGKKILEDAGFGNVITLGLTHDWMGYLMLEEQWKDVNLSYHQSLSPGADCYPKYAAAVQAMVDAAK